MKPWIKEKLTIIRELYPKERLERSKRRIAAVWSGSRDFDRYPFTFAPLTFNYYDDVFDKESGLKAYLDEFICRGRIQDDFIPAFFPGCKQGTIPNMFGAREIVSGKDHTAEKVIFDAADIGRLPEPEIREGSIAREWLDMQAYYAEETEGEIPVHVADMQGPLDVCGQLWGYDNILAAPFEEPEAYHGLMEKVCAAFVLLWNSQKRLLGDLFVGTHLFGFNWVPRDIGASLSMDSMAMISPSFFDEYVKGCLEQIGEALGGLFVHSCGDFSAVMKSLCAVKGLKAVNAGQMSIKSMLEAGLDTSKVVIAMEDAGSASQVFARLKEHALSADISLNGLWPQENGVNIHPTDWTEAHLRQIDRLYRTVLESAYL